jgi:hypothetical protein
MDWVRETRGRPVEESFRQQKTDRTILAVVDSMKEETLVSAGESVYAPNKPQERVFRSATMS